VLPQQTARQEVDGPGMLPGINMSAMTNAKRGLPDGLSSSTSFLSHGCEQQISLLGRIAVSAKLISQEQLLEALQAQDHLGATKRLGDILLELGYISQAQLEWLLRAQQTLLQRERQVEAERQHRANLEEQRSGAEDGTATLPQAETSSQPQASPHGPSAAPVPAQTVPRHRRLRQCSTAFWPEGCSLAQRRSHTHRTAIQMRVGGQLLRPNRRHSIPHNPSPSSWRF